MFQYSYSKLRTAYNNALSYSAKKHTDRETDRQTEINKTLQK